MKGGDFMAYCSNCGTIIEGNARFCTNCGVQLNQENVQSNNGYSNIYNYTGNIGHRSTISNNYMIFMILILIGGVMSVLGVFFPYVKASAFGMSVEYSFQDLAKGDYIILIAIGALCVVFGIFKQYILDILGGILYVIVFYIDSNQYWTRVRSDSRGALASRGLGYYCMLIGCIIVIAFGIAGFIYKQKNKNSI